MRHIVLAYVAHANDATWEFDMLEKARKGGRVVPVKFISLAIMIYVGGLCSFSLITRKSIYIRRALATFSEQPLDSFVFDLARPAMSELFITVEPRRHLIFFLSK